MYNWSQPICPQQDFVKAALQQRKVPRTRLSHFLRFLGCLRAPELRESPHAKCLHAHNLSVCSSALLDTAVPKAQYSSPHAVANVNEVSRVRKGHLLWNESNWTSQFVLCWLTVVVASDSGSCTAIGVIWTTKTFRSILDSVRACRRRCYHEYSLSTFQLPCTQDSWSCARSLSASSLLLLAILL